MKETEGKKSFVSALGMSAVTKYYSAVMRFFMPEIRIREILLDHINPQREENILEFGYGKGKNIIKIHQAGTGAKLWGIDMDPKEHAVAERKLKKMGVEASIALYDGKRIPFRNNTFDKVYSCLVFHHLPPEVKEHVANELYRVLRPGGKIVIADWGRPSNILFGITFHVIQILDGYRTTRDNRKGVIPRLLEKCGFERVEEKDRMNILLGTFSFHTANRP